MPQTRPPINTREGRAFAFCRLYDSRIRLLNKPCFATPTSRSVAKACSYRIVRARTWQLVADVVQISLFKDGGRLAEVLRTVELAESLEKFPDLVSRLVDFFPDFVRTST